MAKGNFTTGDCIIAKRLDGIVFKGLFEYEYNDGSFCIVDVNTNRKYLCKRNDVKMATEDEAKEIKHLAKVNHTTLKERNQHITTNEETSDEELEEALAATE